MPDSYRAVVIGCGRIGSTFADDARTPGVYSHAQAYRTHPRTELVGVADTDPTRLAQAASRWKTEGEPDGVALCRRLRPEIVSLCTPDETHAELACRLLREAAPTVLLIEKPIALRSEDAVDLLELATRQGCAVAVNYSRRFSPAFRALKDELAQGLHGRPLLARFLYSKGLLHNGSHAVDLARWWLGELAGAAAQPVAWALSEHEDSYSAELWFANGCRVRLDPFDERVASVFEMDFHTERSRWRFWLGGEQWEFSEPRESPLYAGYKTYVATGRERRDARFSSPLGSCLSNTVNNLVAFLEGRELLWCTGEDGLAALQLVERVRHWDEPLSTRR